MKFVGLVITAGGLLVSVLAGCSDRGDPISATPGSGEVTSFASDVLPVFQAECVVCHGGADPTAGLNLSGYTDLMNSASEHSPVVIAGDPDGSYLVQKLEGTVLPQMPPPGPLPASQIAIIRKWIAEGAEDN